MAQLYEDEREFQDNSPRLNFVFMGYPYDPPLPRDDYARVVKELQEELPVRFWYFLDEVTTNEMMRKIWRAVLRADLSIFDITRGNPNVAFELGLAVATDKRCMTLLKEGEENPLGSSDLGYSERIEYSSAATLKERLETLTISQCSGLRVIRDLSYHLQPQAGTMPREELEKKVLDVVRHVFARKQITKRAATQIAGTDALATGVLQGLRSKDVLQVIGQRRGARWVFTDEWVYHDHEVTGAI